MPAATQTLSFRLRIARNEADLLAACQVRAESYGRHLPQLRAAFSVPDVIDYHPDTTVFLCVDKQTDSAIGTARIQMNAEAPLTLEDCVELPEIIRNESRAEITRLAVMPKADPLVKLALFKAVHRHCLATQTHWAVVTARSAPLIRQYLNLGFSELFGGTQIPLPHVGNIPHSVLAMQMTVAERIWMEKNHPLYEFMFEVVHRDIDLLSLSSPFYARPTSPPQARQHCELLHGAPSLAAA